MFLHVSVSHSVHRGSASVHVGIPPPRADTPSWEQTPPKSRHTPPGSRHPPRADTPGTEHAGRYGQRAGGTHPTGMQSCYYICASFISLRFYVRWSNTGANLRLKNGETICYLCLDHSTKARLRFHLYKSECESDVASNMLHCFRSVYTYYSDSSGGKHQRKKSLSL